VKKVDAYSEQIAQALDNWLKAEVVISGESRNSYLDASDQDRQVAEQTFADMRARFALPYDVDRNWNAAKDKSHQGRWPGWLQGYTVEPKNEIATAQIGFAPLMSISGAYRSQCYIQASDQSDYLARRVNGIGIDIEAEVNAQLSEVLYRGNFKGSKISFDGLTRLFDYTYAQGEIGIRAMIARLQRGYDLGEEDSRSVESMKSTQRRQVQLATYCIALAAKNRGGNLEAVPFLEPISISDQSGEPHYPLGQEVHWLRMLPEYAVGRVEVKDVGEFNPREWLRRELLWASLMTPYSQQLDSWVSGTQLSQHSGNVSRRDVYNGHQDPESQSLGFFNQGKNIAGLVSSIVLFNVLMHRPQEGASVDILGLQAKAIDKVLARVTSGQFDTVLAEPEIYKECQRLVRLAIEDDTHFSTNARLLRASKIMTGLACQETRDWLAASRQDLETTLPQLTIPDGGHPRSGGDRVDMLQPIFHGFVESEQFRALKT
jgi:hypothetical protein